MPYLIAFLFFSLCHLRKLGWTSLAKWMPCLKGLLIFFPFCFVKEREGTLPIIAGIVFVFILETVKRWSFLT